MYNTSASPILSIGTLRAPAGEVLFKEFEEEAWPLTPSRGISMCGIYRIMTAQPPVDTVIGLPDSW